MPSNYNYLLCSLLLFCWFVLMSVNFINQV